MEQEASTKRCPDCAEEVQAAARVCRYCGFRFDAAAGEAAPAAVSPQSPPAQPAADAPPPPPRRRRSRGAIVLVVLTLVVLAVAGAVVAAAVLSRKSLDEKEMTYVATFVREDYKDAEYYMLGTAMAVARQSASFSGRQPTKAAREKARRFFREGDAYYRRLQALESPSEPFDETHAAWQREVKLERRCLAAVRTWFDNPWSDRGTAASRAASRLNKRAGKAGDAAWALFKAAMIEEASSEQITEVARLQAKYGRQMKED